MDEDSGAAGETAWEQFVKGEFDEIVDQPGVGGEDEIWHRRNPLSHAAAMYLHNFAETSGRASPGEYFWGCVIGAIATAAVLGSAWWLGLFAPVATGWTLLIVIPVACGAIRRVHDAGKGGEVLLRRGGPFELFSESDLHANDFGGPSFKTVGAVGDKLYRRPGR